MRFITMHRKLVLPFAVMVGLFAVVSAGCNLALTVEPTPAEAAVLTPESQPTGDPAAAPTREVIVVTATPTLPPDDPTATPYFVVHIVAAGESLSTIAEQYGVTVEEIVAANALTDPDAVAAGQSLVIPLGDAVIAPTAEVAPPEATPVAEGDVPTAGPPATSTPTLDNLLEPYGIPALTNRPYDGGTVVRDAYITETDSYTQYTFSHTSDGIRVTGLMNIPKGEGPFPVAILLHGGIDQSVYTPGDGTRNHADRMARAGYLALMPDYRSYNNTEGTGTPLKIPWAIDVMNLIEALPTIPEADPERVGVLGHSRGGGIATYIMVLSDVDAVILYAPLHTDQAVVFNQYVNVFGRQWPLDDAAIYGSPTTNPEGYELISPSNYLGQISMPVQIHHGVQDNLLPVQWSRDLFDVMRSMGLTVEYYEYPTGAHTFSGENYETFIMRSITFFDTYVAPSD